MLTIRSPTSMPSVGAKPSINVKGHFLTSTVRRWRTVLDTGIKRVMHKPILIRADYIRVFDAVASYFSRPRLWKAKCAVITGQPGIGEFA
jgi:hypothetical protein